MASIFSDEIASKVLHNQIKIIASSEIEEASIFIFYFKKKRKILWTKPKIEIKLNPKLNLLSWLIHEHLYI